MSIILLLMYVTLNVIDLVATRIISSVSGWIGNEIISIEVVATDICINLMNRSIEGAKSKCSEGVLSAFGSILLKLFGKKRL